MMAARKKNSRDFFARRMLIFSSMFLGYAFFYFNRRAFTFVIPHFIKDVDASKEQLGMIASSLMFAYSISKFCGGVMSDMVSSRYLFCIGLFLSSLCTLAFTLSPSIPVCTALWFVQGLVQGAGWPACGKTLKMWYRKTEFGTYWGLLTTSSNLAGTAGPLLSSYFAINYGWRFPMYLCGVLSIVITFITLAVMRDSPQQLGYGDYVGNDPADSQNGTKSSAKKGKGKGQKVKEAGRLTWVDIVCNPYILILAVCYCITFAVRAGSDWGQLFLIQECGQSEYAASMYVSVVELGGAFSSVISGFISDRVVAKFQSSKCRYNPRLPVLVMFILASVVSQHLLTFTVNETSSQVWVLCVAMLIGLSIYGAISGFGVMAVETAPSYISGTAHAFVALGANVGGFLAGYPLTAVAQRYNWKAAFFLLEVLGACSLLLMFVAKQLNPKLEKVSKKKLKSN